MVPSDFTITVETLSNNIQVVSLLLSWCSMSILSFTSWQYSIPSIDSLSLTNTTCLPCFLDSFWIGYSFFRLSSIAFGNCRWIPNRGFLSRFASHCGTRISPRLASVCHLSVFRIGVHYQIQHDVQSRVVRR